MILFLTGQYAGAQYIHPLLKRWGEQASDTFELIATGPSCQYWDEAVVPYRVINDASPAGIAEYLVRLKPSLVVLSASATIDLEYAFIVAAADESIPTASFIDIWSNYKARFMRQGRPVFPDQILAINEDCVAEMVAEGIDERKIVVVGQPYLEGICTDTPALGFDTLLVSQPIRKHRGRSLGYDETDFLNTCLPAVERARIENVVATRHPDEEPAPPSAGSRYITWREGRGFDDLVDCHTVLGMFSMQMIIGYLWGRRVASVQPGLIGVDPSPLSRWGLIPRLKNTDAVADFLLTDDRKGCESGLADDLGGSLDRFESFCMSR
jgi:hypothetical protein